jgi:hypothetical protein
MRCKLDINNVLLDREAGFCGRYDETSSAIKSTEFLLKMDSAPWIEVLLHQNLSLISYPSFMFSKALPPRFS